MLSEILSSCGSYARPLHSFGERKLPSVEMSFSIRPETSRGYRNQNTCQLTPRERSLFLNSELRIKQRNQKNFPHKRKRVTKTKSGSAEGLSARKTRVTNTKKHSSVYLTWQGLLDLAFSPWQAAAFSSRRTLASSIQQSALLPCLVSACW